MRLPIVLCALTALLHGAMTTRTQVLMGTFVSVTLPERYAPQIQKSFEIVKKVERALSSYQEGAAVYRLNHERKINIDPLTYEALRLSKRYYRQSGGYFDIAVGSITKRLYRFGEGGERVPTTSQLQEADVSFGGVHFNRRFAWLDRGITVDLGGMGKGFAADRVADYLHRQGVDAGIVALSGDIRCLDVCRIAVKNPFGAGIVASFETKHPDTAISTSGNYRRYIGNIANNHLIDPKRKASQRRFASITLLSFGDNTKIDAYATAAAVMPLHRAKAFLNASKLGYLIITTDGNITISENISEYTRNLRVEKLPEKKKQQQKTGELQRQKRGELDEHEDADAHDDQKTACDIEQCRGKKELERQDHRAFRTGGRKEKKVPRDKDENTHGPQMGKGRFQQPRSRFGLRESALVPQVEGFDTLGVDPQFFDKKHGSAEQKRQRENAKVEDRVTVASLHGNYPFLRGANR